MDDGVYQSIGFFTAENDLIMAFLLWLYYKE